MKKISLLFLLGLLLSGCASRMPVGVDTDTQALDLNEKSLLLLTVDLSRKEASRFQPVPKSLMVGTVDAKGLVSDVKALAMDGDGEIRVSGDRTLYVYRFVVPEGKIGITGITGVAKAFPLVGLFYVPLGMEVPVTKQSVIYLGRVEAILRPREDNEYRAGGLIPLIDQAATGMSTGTFDVRLKDNSATDLPLLRSTYPALASAKIVTKLVPVIDREYVDRQWRGEDMAGVDPYKNSRKADTTLVPQEAVTPTPRASPEPMSDNSPQASPTSRKKKSAAKL